MELTDEILCTPAADPIASGLTNSLQKIRKILAASGASSPAVRDFAQGRPSQLQRRQIAQELYEASFDSGKEVIYLSIMSGKNTLSQMPARIRRAEASRTTINVLTWDPNIGTAAMDAFGNHINEESTVLEQTRVACATWQSLAKQYPGTIKKAGHYASSPTLQGLVVLDDWAQIELIPYRTPPSERLSVFFSAELDSKMFSIFQSAFQRLLADSISLRENE